MDTIFSPMTYWEEFGRYSGLAVIATDISGIVQVWSEGAEELYGWTADEALGHPIHELTVGPLERHVADEIMQQVLNGKPWEGDFHARTRHGTIAEVHVLDFPLVDSDGVLAGIVGLSFDVSPKRVGKLNTVVHLRHLAREIHDARQTERMEIARHLHDDLGQVLTVLRSEVRGLGESEPASDAVVTACDRMTKRVDTAIDLVRGISGDLLERTLDVWSLILRAFELTDDLQRRTGVLASCEVFGSVDLLRTVQSHSSVVAFHVMREALTNCERHACATHVQVVIRVTDTHLVLTVEDNGHGITPDSDGVGMRIMRDRVRQACGGLEITNLGPESTTGTRVRAMIPLFERAPVPG